MAGLAGQNSSLWTFEPPGHPHPHYQPSSAAGGSAGLGLKSGSPFAGSLLGGSLPTFGLASALLGSSPPSGPGPSSWHRHHSDHLGGEEGVGAPEGGSPPGADDGRRRKGKPAKMIKKQNRYPKRK
jgi:hypothetical protein